VAAIWCPECNKTFKNEELCPKCGARLTETPKTSISWRSYSPGELLMKWPDRDDGEPVEPVFLKHCSSNNMEDDLLTSLLNAYDIPHIRRMPKDGSFGKVVIGTSGYGTDFYVPETMLEEALGLISSEVDNANIE